MFSREAREVIGDVLELFAQASELPITMYQPEPDGNMTEVARSSQSIFPSHCFAVWNLKQGEGRKVCEENMCSRARAGFDSVSQQTSLCHAGLTVSSDPIVVSGNVIAVIVYGAYVVLDEDEDHRELRIARHERAMKALRATPEETAEIRHLLTEEAPQADIDYWNWMHKTLPPIIGRLIAKYVIQDERERKVSRLAYHEVQLRLQAALASAENVSRHIRRERFPNEERIGEIDYVTGAIEAAGTVMTNSSRGQYLPNTYRFVFNPVSEFIYSALKMCRQEAREREIEFDVDLQPDDRVRIPASDLHLQQAFNNLVHNAVKYSYRRPVLKPGETVRPPRFISVRGGIHRLNGEVGYRVSIGNYGVGIEEDELEKIFLEGYQGRLTKAEYRTGSGQGLNLTQKIIAKHHGTITVHSEPRGDILEDGSGPHHTLFTIWLPFKQPSEESNGN